MDPRAALTSNNKGGSNLQAHMALDSFVNQENAQKEKAAMQEAAYYERLNQEAEKMLGPDRKRFDEMVSNMQGTIREKISMYGGNRRDFLKNGGHKVIQQFSNKLQNTDEYNNYIKNKENYVKIKDAMEKGYGHLLTLKDRKSVENYEASGSGRITYSGVMNEIKMPDDNNYDLGSDIPMTDILYNEDNYMKVVGNYMLNNPEDKNPQVEDLLGFMKLMGYGKKGSNRDLLNLKRKMALEKTRASLKEPKLKKDTRPQLFTTNLAKMQTYVPKGSKINDFYDVEGSSYLPKEKIKTMSSTDSFLSSNIDNPWKQSSYAVNEDESGWDADTDNFLSRTYNKNFGKQWSPAEANEVAGQHKETIAEHFLNIERNDSGNYQLDPSDINDMYSTKGVELIGENNLEAGEYSGQYKNLGVITGLFGKTKDGNNQMLMKITDSSGEHDVDEQRDFVEGMDDSEVKMGYFIALRNLDNERIYYKKINMDDPNKLASLSSKIGSADDLKKQNESVNRLQGEFDQAESQSDQEEANFDQQLLMIDQSVSQSANFLQESNLYSNPDNGNDNRSSIMKSFYTITGLDVNSQSFHQFMQMFPESSKLMRTYGHNTSEEELIDVLVTEMNQGEDESTIASNEAMGRQWKNAYNRYLEINKE